MLVELVELVVGYLAREHTGGGRGDLEHTGGGRVG